MPPLKRHRSSAPRGSPSSPPGGRARPILVVVAHLRENGGLRMAHEAAKRLPAHGLATQLFVVRRIREGVELIPAPELPVTFGAQGPIRLRCALPRIVARLIVSARRSSVVLSGSEVGPAFLLGWLAARATGRPFAVLVQASLSGALSEWVPRRLHGLTGWVYAHTDLAICVSPGLVPEVHAAGVPLDQVVVVHVGVDVDASIAAAAAPTAAVVDRPYVVAVGRLVPQKGFDTLLRAFARARERLGEHRLVIVGEGPERASLEDLARELGVADRVDWLGFLTNPHPVMAGASLFALPSRYEGMGGLVLLEAMSHAVPIIATDCISGPRDLLEDGRYGRLVPPEDVDALAAALADHVADPELLRSRAVGGPQRARAFAPEKWAPRFRDALSDRFRTLNR